LELVSIDKRFLISTNFNIVTFYSCFSIALKQFSVQAYPQVARQLLNYKATFLLGATSH